MDQKQSFNLSADFLGGFSSIFMKLVFVIISVYIIILTLNFLRDKFISKEQTTKRDDIIDLLTILNKLFFISGFGFVIGNIFQVLLSGISNRNSSLPSMNFRGEWDYLTFGIILIFIGIGFKIGKKAIKKDRIE
jgi:hypothetical protein